LFYKWYFIFLNVQNLLCFPAKSTFFKATKIIFVKKKKKYFLGQLYV
jgi:hypothetical protein